MPGSRKPELTAPKESAEGVPVAPSSGATGITPEVTPHHANVHVALAAVQAEIPSIERDRTVKIPGKEGREGYEYRYATLGEIHKTLLPLLGRHGLAWTCVPTMGERSLVLRFALTHGPSGTAVTGELPLGADGNPQALGSRMTYYRRYALSSVVGVAAEEDDDGAVAAAEHRARSQRPAEQREQRQERRQEPPAPAQAQVDAVARRVFVGPLADLANAGLTAQTIGALGRRPSREVLGELLAGLAHIDLEDLPKEHSTVLDLLVWRIADDASAVTTEEDLRDVWQVAKALEGVLRGTEVTPGIYLADYLRQRVDEVRKPAPAGPPKGGSDADPWATPAPEGSGAPDDSPWDTGDRPAVLEGS